MLACIALSPHSQSTAIIKCLMNQTPSEKACRRVTCDPCPQSRSHAVADFVLSGNRARPADGRQQFGSSMPTSSGNSPTDFRIRRLPSRAHFSKWIRRTCDVTRATPDSGKISPSCHQAGSSRYNLVGLPTFQDRSNPSRSGIQKVASASRHLVRPHVNDTYRAVGPARRRSYRLVLYRHPR